ncbi:hypothetical protein C8A00DRAFT_19294 [Chaetomidium leptoderma]|uniref:Cellobiose dehydrogenase-like cytochrome domain-containing protein n=1 Tax=Chaetomidium leptoderma TaxID=669021 RepID=A0AAN6VDN2_9PEZI|nr:hypothetical protein C8A00DRAFT_19294 [Chaetomidium leptoderma]
MKYPNFSSALTALLLAWAAATPADTASSSQPGLYTDVDTGITFYGFDLTTGYRFGLVMPQQPTADFIAQLVSPLTDGGGWGGVSLGAHMTGPLLIVTWPDGDTVMTSTRVATDYTTAGVFRYGHNPVGLPPLKRGTFVNNTHVSSTFLCAGCINSDSFDPAWANATNRDVFFGYAYSQIAVEDPSDTNTNLSDHIGTGTGFGVFKVALGDAMSEDYDKYAAMVEWHKDGVAPQQPAHSTLTSMASPTSLASPTSTSVARATVTTALIAVPTTAQGWKDGCWESECEMPDGPDFSHREMPRLEFIVLLLLGVVYLGQALLS